MRAGHRRGTTLNKHITHGEQVVPGGHKCVLTKLCAFQRECRMTTQHARIFGVLLPEISKKDELILEVSVDVAETAKAAAFMEFCKP